MRAAVRLLRVTSYSGPYVVASLHLVAPDAHDIRQKRPQVAAHVERRFGSKTGRHWHLHQVKAKLARQEQDLDVKGERIDPRAREQRALHRPPEPLEAALRIADD